LAKVCSIRYIKNQTEGGQIESGQKSIIHDGWGYGVGMPLISYYNTKINKFKQNTGNDFKDMYALFKVFRAWNEYMDFKHLENGASHLPKSRKKSTSYNYTIKKQILLYYKRYHC